MPLSVKVEMAIRGKLSAYPHCVAVAATTGIRAATSKMKTQGRRQMQRAGLGTKLPNAFRGEVRAGDSGQDITRRGLSLTPVGRVSSNAFVKRANGRVDLIEIFEHGAVIVPNHGRFLAVPTPEAGGRRARPASSYPGNTFRFVRLKRRRGRPRGNAPVALLVHKARNEVWYLLFETVRLRKRLELGPLYQRIAAKVPADIDARFAREVTRAVKV